MPSQNVMLISVYLAALIALSEVYPSLAKQVTPAVVFACGKPRLYLTSGGWIQDIASPCSISPSEVIRYCHHVYPNQSFSHAVPSPVVRDTIRDWCNPHNASCSRNLGEVYDIQPWICTTNESSQLLVPPDCELRIFGGESVHHCMKEDFWFNKARTNCAKVTQVKPVKPCIRSGSYLHHHFLGMKAVCCGNGVLAGETLESPSLPPVSHYPVVTDRHSTKFRERQSYLNAKQAEQAALASRKALLLQNFLTAEGRLTDQAWVEHPVETQKAEDLILEDFRHGYLNLSLDAQQNHHHIDSAHQQRVLDFMRQNEATMLSLLENIVSNKPVNLSHLMQHMERVLHVIENNRFHVLKRFERLRSLHAENISDELSMLKERLVELDKVFNTSLLKLSRVPKYEPVIVQHISKLRETEYAHVESFAKSVLVSVDPERTDPLERAALDADELISRYRHHFINKNMSNGLMDSWREKHNKKHFSLHEDGASVLVASSDPSQPNTTSLQTKTAFIQHNSPVITGVLVFTFLFIALVCALFAIRRYRRRARLQRAGYTSSLVEVDEVQNPGVPVSTSRHDPSESDVMTYWIPGGFENPSYKYSDKLLR